MKFTSVGRRTLLLAATLALASGQVLAQAWPSRPVKLIVPIPAGSAPDVVARVLAERLGQIWGQTVFVENRPGAGGIPGMSTLAKSSNDGYTLGFVPAAMATVTPLLYKNPQFNIDADMSPVATVGISPLMVVANSQAPYSTLAELEKHAKANPSKLNLAAPQMNSLPHIAIEVLNKTGHLGLTTVPYPGAPAAVTAVIAGEAAITADGIPGVLQHVKSGRLKALAVGSDKRLPGFENVPTAAETYPGYEFVGWFAIFVPTGFPAANIEKINADVNKVIQMPDVVARLAELGIYPKQGSVAQAREFVTAQRKLHAKVIEDLGVQPQ